MLAACNSHHYSIYLISLIAWLIVVLPTPIYLLSAGLRKFHKYQAFFIDRDFFQQYFKLYYPGEQVSDADALESLRIRFAKNFQKQHGFRNYVTPWTLTSV